MTTLSGCLTIAAVLTLSAIGLRWQIRRARAADACNTARDRIIREANVRVGLTPPAADNWPGVNVADQDACELIWSMPEHDPELAAGCDRLWDAIDEHRKENP
jgi:hypothetical protein